MFHERNIIQTANYFSCDSKYGLKSAKNYFCLQNAIIIAGCGKREIMIMIMIIVLHETKFMSKGGRSSLALHTV